MSQRPNVHITSGIIPLNNQQAEESSENPSEINQTNGMDIITSGENYQEKEDENSENKFCETSKENKEIKGEKINVETSVIYWKNENEKEENSQKIHKEKIDIDSNSDKKRLNKKRERPEALANQEVQEMDIYELERQRILIRISEREAKIRELNQKIKEDKDRLQKLDEDRNRGKGNDNDGADEKMKT